jgi:hypothetical protein
MSKTSGKITTRDIESDTHLKDSRSGTHAVSPVGYAMTRRSQVNTSPRRRSREITELRPRSKVAGGLKRRENLTHTGSRGVILDRIPRDDLIEVDGATCLSPLSLFFPSSLHVENEVGYTRSSLWLCCNPLFLTEIPFSYSQLRTSESKVASSWPTAAHLATALRPPSRTHPNRSLR